MKKLTSARSLALFGLAGALIGLWSATRTWITVDVASSSVQIPQIVVDGATAAASVTAVCVVVLAGSLALLIAGKVARYIIAAICLLAGATVITAGIGALRDPQAVASTAVAEATGLAQNAGEYTLTAWPAVAVIAGVLIVLQAVLVLVFAGRWPAKASKYDRQAAKASVEPKDQSSRNIASWEQLSQGEDPTAGGK
ncbi:Trp biosynthesis-associated membrane protein [Glutamicibacter sp. ZJUTW]|uniref:Trp biosynthesis-associated membrane protein n=1 Tax=Glutamicibacter sp. ZJUTW TaxID=1155384 RepID=UPI0011F24A6C|nr:Trp biosynthesis-associated membrane protein [Glutamicibacter sp. ZJUTW]QEP07506.1 Trp biosynthesis-associated membrane protein [Glutamicibacter sp. ZJUTW]